MKFYEFNKHEYYALILALNEEEALKAYEEEIVGEIEEDEIDPSPICEETITTTISNDDISKLKPCPKCGGEGELDIGYDTEKVVCKQCGAKTRTFVGDYYDEGFMDGDVATAWWNRGEVIESKNEV